MSVLREIVTLFTFQTDKKGLNEYSKVVTGAMDKVKSTMATVGAILGTELAISSAASFISGLTADIRKARTLTTQMSQILTPDIDTDEMMGKIFTLAQDTGAAYTEVAARFKDIAVSARAVGVSQETAFEATTNISKALEVGRASAEDQQATFDALNNAFSRGELGARQLNMMLMRTPKVVETLAKNLGTSVAGLVDLADKGKLSTDIMVKGFSKTNALLDKEFMEKPNSLGDAFNYVWNEMVRVGIQVWKLTGGLSKLANMIIASTKRIVGWGEAFVKWIGGAEKALELLQYAFMAALGLGTIKLITTAAASFRALALAIGLATWQFTLIAGAIAFIALAIEDIMVWVRGEGKSVTGEMLGPFADFKKKIDEIFKPFTDAMEKFKKGDIFGGLNDALGGILGFREKLGPVNQLILDIAAAAATVYAGIKIWDTIKFVMLIAEMGFLIVKTLLVEGAAIAVKVAMLAWNAIKFAGGILAAVMGLSTEVGKVKTATDAVDAGFKALNKITFDSLIASIGLIAVPVAAATASIAALLLENERMKAAVEQTTNVVKPVVDAGKPAPTISELATQTGQDLFTQEQSAAQSGYYVGSAFEEWYQQKKRELQAMLPESIGGKMNVVPEIDPTKRRSLSEATTSGPGQAPPPIGTQPKQAPIGTQPAPIGTQPKPAPVEIKEVPIGATPQAAIAPEQKGWIERNIPDWLPQWLGGPAGTAVPAATPGAIANAPAAKTELNNNMPVTNNVNVTVPTTLGELEFSITNIVDKAMTQNNENVARALSTANPRAEVAAAAP